MAAGGPSPEFLCGLCMGQFHEPKALPCLHSFCLRCLDNFVRSDVDAEKRGGILCPLCGAHAPCPSPGQPPHNWAALWPTNFFLLKMDQQPEGPSLMAPSEDCYSCRLEGREREASSWCRDCAEAFCESCRWFHSRMPSLMAHDLQALHTTTMEQRQNDRMRVKPGEAGASGRRQPLPRESLVAVINVSDTPPSGSPRSGENTPEYVAGTPPYPYPIQKAPTAAAPSPTARRHPERDRGDPHQKEELPRNRKRSGPRRRSPQRLSGHAGRIASSAGISTASPEQDAAWPGAGIPNHPQTLPQDAAGRSENEAPYVPPALPPVPYQAYYFPPSTVYENFARLAKASASPQAPPPAFKYDIGQGVVPMPGAQDQALRLGSFPHRAGEASHISNAPNADRVSVSAAVNAETKMKMPAAIYGHTAKMSLPRPRMSPAVNPPGAMRRADAAPSRQAPLGGPASPQKLSQPRESPTVEDRLQCGTFATSMRTNFGGGGGFFPARSKARARTASPRAGTHFGSRVRHRQRSKSSPRGKVRHRVPPLGRHQREISFTYSSFLDNEFSKLSLIPQYAQLLGLGQTVPTPYPIDQSQLIAEQQMLGREFTVVQANCTEYLHAQTPNTFQAQGTTHPPAKQANQLGPPLRPQCRDISAASAATEVRPPRATTSPNDGRNTMQALHPWKRDVEHLSPRATGTTLPFTNMASQRATAPPAPACSVPASHAPPPPAAGYLTPTPTAAAARYVPAHAVAGSRAPATADAATPAPKMPCPVHGMVPYWHQSTSPAPTHVPLRQSPPCTLCDEAQQTSGPTQQKTPQKRPDLEPQGPSKPSPCTVPGDISPVEWHAVRILAANNTQIPPVPLEQSIAIQHGTVYQSTVRHTAANNTQMLSIPIIQSRPVFQSVLTQNAVSHTATNTQTRLVPIAEARPKHQSATSHNTVRFTDAINTQRHSVLVDDDEAMQEGSTSQNAKITRTRASESIVETTQSGEDAVDGEAILACTPVEPNLSEPVPGLHISRPSPQSEMMYYKALPCHAQGAPAKKLTVYMDPGQAENITLQKEIMQIRATTQHSEGVQTLELSSIARDMEYSLNPRAACATNTEKQPNMVAPLEVGQMTRSVAPCMTDEMKVLVKHEEAESLIYTCTSAGSPNRKDRRRKSAAAQEFAVQVDSGSLTWKAHSDASPAKAEQASHKHSGRSNSPGRRKIRMEDPAGPADPSTPPDAAEAPWPNKTSAASDDSQQGAASAYQDLTPSSDSNSESCLTVGLASSAGWMDSSEDPSAPRVVLRPRRPVYPKLVARVSTRLKGNLEAPWVRDVVVMPCKVLLASDFNNQCLKAWEWGAHKPRISVYKLDSAPFGLADLDGAMVAVTLPHAWQVVVMEVTSPVTLIRRAVFTTERGYFGVAALGPDRLAALCPDVRLIDIIDLRGQVLSTLQTDKLGQPLMECSYYISPAGHGDLIFSDFSAGCVQRVSGMSEVRWSWGQGRLREPHGVCKDDEGFLYVADCSGGRASGTVWRLTPDGGGPVRVLTHDDDGLEEPWGLAWFSGHLVVGDSGAIRVYYMERPT